MTASGVATSMDVPSQPSAGCTHRRPSQVLKILVAGTKHGSGDPRSPDAIVDGRAISFHPATSAKSSITADVRLVTGHTADHALIHALLRAANQSPSYDDFVTWLDEPTYEPADRLLVKDGERIVAHVQLLARTAWFDSVKVPIGLVQDLAVLPEYVQAGYDRLLLDEAEQALRQSQAIVAIVRTTRPEPFRAAGWTDVRGQGHSEVGISDLLAHLAAQSAATSKRLRHLLIRRWRHVELDAVRNIYSAAAASQWGAVYRSDAYWRWLIGRNAHSELIVAADGQDEWEELESSSRIVGYVVMHGAQVLELLCLPEFARSASRLLVRACQDAIERDHRTLTLHTPPSDSLHELVVTAGGTWCTGDPRTSPTLLVKLLDPSRWIEAIYPLLRRRAKRAGLARPLELCFDTRGEKYRLLITRRRSRLVADVLLHASIHCDPTTFGALLVGNLNITKAHAAARLTTADDDKLRTLTALFPPCLFWQSQFDALRF